VGRAGSGLRQYTEADMQAMQRTLQTLVPCCQGNDRPDCPILDDLATTPGNRTAARKMLLHS